MKNSPDELVKRWGRSRQGRPAPGSEELVQAVMRRVRQAADAPQRNRHFPSRGAFRGLWWSAAGAAGVLVALGVVWLDAGKRSEPGTRLTVYSVRCEAVFAAPAAARPLVELARYETLFQAN